MEDSRFDIIICGTGLTESIVAAALSKWGFRVAHIDRNPYYGGDEASLTLDEFAKWVDSLATESSRYSRASRSETIPPFARQYSICLCPTIIPSIGPFIDALIQSSVSKYSGFRLLERVAVYDGAGGFKSAPGSKEDVFKNKDISLIQKRRLMRFLTFAVGDFEQSTELQGKHDLPFTEFLETVFSLSKELIAVIAFALAYSSNLRDPTISVLPRIRRYLRSVGRYGPSPFLVGHYGGVGEISQGFCRAAAVNGAVYILGRDVVSVNVNSAAAEPGMNPNPAEATSDEHNPQKPHRYSVSLEDIPEPLFAHAILGPTSYMPPQLLSDPQHNSVSPACSTTCVSVSTARCVAIIEHPIMLHSPPQTKYLDEDDDDVDDGDGDDDADDNKNCSKEEAPSTDKALDNAVLVFPPGSLDGGSLESSAVVLMTGEGTLSTPKGKYILYISLQVAGNTEADPSQMLRPYLDTVLKLGKEDAREALFTAFYVESLKDIPARDVSQLDSRIPWLVPPPVPLGPLGDIADTAAQNAEVLFFKILQALGDNEERYQKGDAQNSGIWPKMIATEDEDEV